MNLAKMHAARKAAQRQRDREAISRVEAYTAWLKAGSVLRDIPTLPTDADWAVARREGVVR